MRKKCEIEDAFADRRRLGEAQSFFLVGIGGAGMSALAAMLHRQGFRVRGSDSTVSPATAELLASGIEVRIGHSGEPIEAGDAVILTDAIDLTSSPEVRRARELGCPLFRRSQLLGFLLRNHRVIAVTGTHGKTTTTGMVAAGLAAAGPDPLAIVGAAVPEWGGPVLEGGGDWAVVEACEAYDSFHDLDPEVVVLTNLEMDHSDFHGSFDNLKASVQRFVNRAQTLVYCTLDAGASDIAGGFTGNAVSYGLELPSGLALPGHHNQINAAGALAACVSVGADPEVARQGIVAFKGAERRLQVHREGAITVVDDYAHHPTEVAASIEALRSRYPDRRLIVVFQPHLYSRTSDFLSEFALALSGADLVVITDIYPAREDPIPGISSARIAELTAGPCRYVPSRFLLPRVVAELSKPGDLVVGMGAGNISEFVPAFLAEIDRSGPTRVAIIEGGDSAEREVSLLSGRAIERALLAKGYDAYRLDVTERLLSAAGLGDLIGSKRPDLAFLAGHGTHAEDGAIQGLLELLHIPYTGSGIQSSALAMDKNRTKLILEAHGIRLPKSIFVGWKELPIVEAMAESLRCPFVVKPNAQGSTIGLSFVDDRVELQGAVEWALQYDDHVLIEEQIWGMEISVPVLGDRALPPVEICPAGERYDFAAKYTVGATEEICPARLPANVLAEAEALALKCHQALGCDGATRTDMMVWMGEGGHDLYVLEVNTLPGLTGTSLLPNSAAAAGLSFEELVHWIAQEALSRHAHT